MSLSNEVIARFVKAAKVEEKKPTESTVYGTVVEYEGKKYVRIDGSDRLTPVSSSASANNDERVSVLIKNHSATITGNMSSPAARTDDVDEIGNQIAEFEIVVADKVSVKEFDAQSARIEELIATDVTIRGTLEAANAEIERLTAKDAEITGTLTANKAEIDELIAKKIDADIVAAKYAEIGDLTALRAEIRDLDATFGDFEILTTEKFEATDAVIENLDTTYANIDFANIGEAAFRKLFSESGLIKDLITENGTITGELVGVTIKGDLIEANTLKADKLVVKGSDGLYYKLNIEGGATTSAEVSKEDLENGLSGSVIVAKSITADKVRVTDLVAFDATIGGFHIGDHTLYSGVKSSALNTTRGVYLGDTGEFAVGDTSHFLRYFYDEATDTYKLEISADVVKMGGTSINDVESKVSTAELNINSIIGQLSTLVTDNNGQSLMTQTANGWTFSTKGIQESLNGISDGLNGLSESVGNAETVVNELNTAMADFKETTEYIHIKVYEDEPCIELGESDTDFKLMVTNTRIMYLDGSGAIPTYVDRTGVVTDNVTVKNTITQGNYSWVIRPNGHLTLMWTDTPLVTYSITHTFSNVSSSNIGTTAQEGKTYRTTLTPSDGYSITSVTVHMDEVNITAAVYTPSAGTIIIPNVTGRIVITATATVNTYSITKNFTDVTTTNTVTSVQHNSSWSAVLSVESGHILSSVVVTMGGINITAEVINGNSIYISNVTNDVIITATSISANSICYITTNLDGVESSNAITQIAATNQYTTTLTADKSGYEPTDVIVTMSGVDVTDSVYNSDTGAITILNVLGDIVITANAAMIIYSVTSTLNDSTLTNNAGSVQYGIIYITNVNPDTGYQIDSVTITMGGNDITSESYEESTGTVTINGVIGDIVINVVTSVKKYTVTYDLESIISSNTATLAIIGSSYTTSLTVDVSKQDYAVGNVTVTMGGFDITHEVYSDGGNSISISEVTEDIVIAAKAVPIVTLRVIAPIDLVDYLSTEISGNILTTNNTGADNDGQYGRYYRFYYYRMAQGTEISYTASIAPYENTVYMDQATVYKDWINKIGRVTDLDISYVLHPSQPSYYEQCSSQTLKSFVMDDSYDLWIGIYRND